MALYVITEEASRLSESFKKEHDEIDWNQIRGMRNVLAHAYFNFLFEVGVTTLKEDLPALIEICNQYIKENSLEYMFDEGEEGIKSIVDRAKLSSQSQSHELNNRPKRDIGSR